MKLFSSIAAAAVIGTSFIAATSVEASIVADLDESTVTGRNDGFANVTIIRGGEVVKTEAEAARTPPSTEKLQAQEKRTVKMTSEGYKYYFSEFDRLQAVEIEHQRSSAEQKLRLSGRGDGGGCPSGTREYRKTALFGLIKGKTMCLSDYQAESLNQQRIQNLNNSRPRNCTTNFIGSTGYTNCY